MCHRAARIFKSPTHKMAIYFLSLQSLSLTVCTSSSEHFQPSPIQVQVNMQVCFKTYIFIFKYYLRVFKYFSQLARLILAGWLETCFSKRQMGGHIS